MFARLRRAAYRERNISSKRAIALTMSAKGRAQLKTEESAVASASTTKAVRRKRKHVEVEDEAEPVLKDEVDVAPEILSVEPKCELPVEYKLKESRGGAPAPKNWQIVLDTLIEYRRTHLAPVDTHGCDSFKHYVTDPKTSRYHALVGLMLSAMTKDEVTSAAMGRLREYGLTVDHILETEVAKIQELIYPVGFHSRKANFIKKTTEVLKEKYDGDIPPTVEEIMDLPGVGPKMAHLAMLIAWGKASGIGVDTHVHRIANRLGWVNTDLPEKTRVELEKWLPEEYWTSVNKVLVGFGQTVCLPLASSRRCDICPVNTLCPSSFKGTTVKKPAGFKKAKLE